jgi:hypothetical protein
MKLGQRLRDPDTGEIGEVVGFRPDGKLRCRTLETKRPFVREANLGITSFYVGGDCVALIDGERFKAVVIRKSGDLIEAMITEPDNLVWHGAAVTHSQDGVILLKGKAQKNRKPAKADG